MTRIAILHYSVPPIIGGVEVTIAAHARLLRAHGYDVQQIAGRGEGAALIREIDSRHPRVELVQQALNHGAIPPEYAALVDDLERVLRHALHGIDLLIAHNLVTLHKNLALTDALHRIITQGKLPLLAWSHDFAWQDPVYADDVHPGMPWDLMRTPWANTRYVVVSQDRRAALAQLLGVPREEIAVVPPGVDAAEFFGFSATTQAWLRELQLDDAAPLLLLPARVTRRKNIELAIEIVNALRARGQPAKLLVMGPLGPHNPANAAYLNELKTLAGGTASVVFLAEHGSVGDPERRDLYWMADALLFPSAREGFGIPILEAGLARLPIFCADIPPFHESAGELATYFGLDEPPDVIAARIADALAHDPRYRLKRHVSKDYSWEAIFREKIEPLLSPHDTPRTDND